MPIYIAETFAGETFVERRIFSTKRTALKYAKSFIDIPDNPCIITQYAANKHGEYRKYREIFNNQEL